MTKEIPAPTAANRERRIKKNVWGQPSALRVHSGRGFGETCQAEMQMLAFDAFERGKVPAKISYEDGITRVEDLSFRGALELAWRSGANKEVLLAVGGGRSGSHAEYLKTFTDVPWDLYLPANARVAVRAASQKAQLFHEGGLRDMAGEVLSKQGFAPDKAETAEHLVDVRVTGNRVVFSLAIPGANAFRRGYKEEHAGVATIREDLAYAATFDAAVHAIKVLGPHWQPDVISVPFAGSGTLGFEAALFYGKIPPRCLREDWGMALAPSFPERSLAHWRSRAAEKFPAGSPPVEFIDNDADVIRILQTNVPVFTRMTTAAGFRCGEITAVSGDALAVRQRPGMRSFLPLNPPYGLRLENAAAAKRLYSNVGTWLSQWRNAAGFILGPEEMLTLASKEMAKSCAVKLHRFQHGGLAIGSLAFAMPPA